MKFIYTKVCVTKQSYTQTHSHTHINHNNNTEESEKQKKEQKKGERTRFENGSMGNSRKVASKCACKHDVHKRHMPNDTQLP